MEQRADCIREVRSLFQERGGGAIPTSALQFILEPIDFVDAKALNRLWHSRLPRIGDPVCIMRASLCYGAVFDGFYYASAIWTHPVNRSLPQDEWLELRRLAIAPDAPKNTASRMLAVMAKLIRVNRPDVARLVSYSDTEVHTGTIYAAAGWIRTAETPYTPWSNKKRTRPEDQSKAAKQRWEKVIREEGK